MAPRDLSRIPKGSSRTPPGPLQDSPKTPPRPSQDPPPENPRDPPEMPPEMSKTNPKTDQRLPKDLRTCFLQPRFFNLGWRDSQGDPPPPGFARGRGVLDYLIYFGCLS